MAEPTTQLFFDATKFERQLGRTRLVQSVLIGSIAFGWFGGLLPGMADSRWPLIVLGAGFISWLVANQLSGTTARQAIAAAQLIAAGAPVEDATPPLAGAMKRFTLYRPVHVLIYHQLAVLLHRQKRFDESASISVALLSLPTTVKTADTRNKLLLLLADASMHRGDPHGAYGALSDLYRSKLDLGDALQLLELQTRYQLMCGRHREAIDQLEHKVAMAELMPPGVSATCHRMFAQAAEALGQTHTAKWLADRALLVWPEPQAVNVSDGYVSPIDAMGLANRA